MMRADEEYTKKVIETYLKKEYPNINITPGNDPPDYLVEIGSRKVALEITRSESISSLELQKNDIDKNLKRKTVDESLSRLCDQLNNRFKLKIPIGISLLLHLEGLYDHNQNLANSRKL